MTAALILPTYNEFENLVCFVSIILNTVPFMHILIVDDNSPDGTGELADVLAAEHPDQISVLHRPRKEGLGAAYIAGYQNALDLWPDAEFFIQMDADFSHDPSYLPALLEVAQHADVVVGSRYVNGVSIVNWPLHRLIISRLGTTETPNLASACMNEKQPLNGRGLTSFIVLFNFLIMLLSGIMLYLSPRGRVANWTGWTMWGLEKGEWEALHLTMALAMLVAAGFHSYFNWSYLVRYIKDAANRGMRSKRELGLASLVMIVLFAGTQAGIPPFSWL